MKKGCLYWITGLSGAGKTTIGTALYYKLKEKHENVLLLDGDVLKTIFEKSEVEYTEEARRERAMRYAHLCKTLVDQGMIVVCCTIAMYDDVRDWNRDQNDKYVEVFLDVPMDVLKRRDQKGLYSGYQSGNTTLVAGLDVGIEYPKNPDVIICNDGRCSVSECVKKIFSFEVKDKYQKIDDGTYWNAYYETSKVPVDASDFAQYINEKYLTPKFRLLELGCGNGRDSLFFANNDIEVVGIDSSETAINKLRTKHKDENVLFVCDDFTCTNTLYQQQFDYCYSRFTLHAISLKQEEYVLKNVYQSLKTEKNKGYFFIEVRSVNDDIFGKGECVGKDSYIYEKHFRRFLRLEELVGRLKKAGFSIVSAEEKRGFAVYGEQNPPIIRIVAKKEKNE